MYSEKGCQLSLLSKPQLMVVSVIIINAYFKELNYPCHCRTTSIHYYESEVKEVNCSLVVKNLIILVTS